MHYAISSSVKALMQVDSRYALSEKAGRREQKKPPRLRELFAGVPGLEPRMDEPESPVLPITPYPNWQASRLLGPFRLRTPDRI